MPEVKNSICDEVIFQSFFREHAQLLRNFLYYKFGDADDAEDVVQDAFVKLWKNCAKVPFEKAKGYVYTVASNMSTSIKRHEKVKLKYEVAAVHTDRTNESPEYLLQEKEYLDKLNNTIARLPERQREAFLLNRVEKKTYKEIAEVMHVSVKAIEKLMHKALLKLRKDLGDV